MPAGRLDLVMEQGVRFRKTIYIKDDDGNAEDIENYNFEMHIRHFIGDTDVIKAITVANGLITISTPTTDGKIVIELSDTDTSALSFDNAVYDIEMTDAAGKLTRILEGIITMRREVTKPEGVIMSVDVLGPIRLGAGELLSGYDYQVMSLPMSPTVTRVHVVSTTKASVVDGEIEIRSEEAGGGTLFCTVTVPAGDYEGEWAGTEFIINRTLGHKLVVRCKTGAVMTDVNISFDIKV